MSTKHHYQKKLLAVACAAGLSSFTSELIAAEEVEAEAEKSSERIEVTGSRIKRMDLEGASPVVVISGDQLVKEGFTTVSEALSSLTAAFGSAQNDLNSNGGFTPNANVINLRALGPGRNLVLINGRRVADYPLPYNGQSNTVNTGSIPSAAIERIEVLTGGASAIYGSDAIAGVINIILRSDYSGNTVSVRMGTPTEGGGNTQEFKWVGGHTESDWNVTYALQYLTRPMIQGYERDFMDSSDDNPDGTVNPPLGLRIRNRGLSTSAANNYVLPTGYTVEDVCDNFSQYNPFSFTTTSSAGATVNLGAGCTFKQAATYQSIRNGDKDMSAYVFGNMDLSNDLRAFASVIAWQQEAESNTGVLGWTSNVFYDTSMQQRLDLTRTFTPDEIGGPTGDGMLRVFKEKTIDLALGLEGELGSYDWSATLSHSKNDSENDRPRLLVGALNDYFLGPQNGTTRVGSTNYPNHVFSRDNFFNPVNPEIWKTLTSNVHTEGDAKVSQLNLLLRGDLFDLPAGPVGFAWVAEAAKQDYELTADPRIIPNADGTSRNIIYGLTGTGGGGERERYATGLELAVPIVKGLEAQIAGRFDKYDDVTSVDDAVTYNFGLTYQPFDSLKLRTMWATSFRAPDMHYVFAESSGSYSTVRDEFRCRGAGLAYTACTASAYNPSTFTVSSGNLDLEEEKGESFNFGFVWDIVEDLSFSADYYKIELDGMVQRIEAETIMRREAECRIGTDRDGAPSALTASECVDYVSRVRRYADGPNVGLVELIYRSPINRSFQSSEGVDAKLNYLLRTESFGNFKTELNWTHVLDLKRSEFPQDPKVSYRDDPENFDFRSRTRLSLGWELDNWGTTLLAQRSGSLPNWAETGRIKPFTTVNWTVGYKADDHLSMGLSVSNVFNKFHPEDDTYNSYPYFYRAYSPIGREVALQATYSF